MSIEGMFDTRTLANMNVALERVCDLTANGESHPVRKRIAVRIIKCARSGKVTLGELTAAGRRGLPRYAPVRKRVNRRQATVPATAPAEI
jgi:predicted MarR family transcription regulator